MPAQICHLWRPTQSRYRLAVVPLSARVFVLITSLGGLAMVARQIRDLLRQKRNLKHWERDEPLEKTDGWD